MLILGISAYYHDSAAALLKDGSVLAAVQEERFTRIKNDASFPVHAINYCLQEAGILLNELDAVVFYDKPFLKFERILQMAIEHAPKGLPLFLQSMPVWLKEKLFLKSEIRKQLKEINGGKTEVPLLFSSHHLSHAASAYYASPFDSAAILTIDGVGEWATASISKGDKNSVSVLKEIHFPDSLGLLYASVTFFLGFKINEGEYKVMGLAPYASPDDELVKKYYRLFMEKLVHVSDTGALKLSPGYFSYTYAPVMIPVKKWEQLFELKRRTEKDLLQKEHAAMAVALQLITEEVVLKMAHYAHAVTGSPNLCLAGGVALNCVANGKLREQGVFKNIYVQPASGDAGGALGAALAAYHLHYKKERIPEPDFMQHGSLGPSYGLADIWTAIHEAGLDGEELPEALLMEKTAEALKNGKVVGWFNGRMEFGPRALGFRSILGDAAHPEMQKILNLKIKKRESFRPFAPIMLEEELPVYFSAAVPNAYMLFVHKINPEWRKERPADYFKLPMQEMLSLPGSVLPAVTHVDYSARIQTVSPGSGTAIRKLLEVYKKLTGRGVLINTSFNVKDEPIVCTPDDAIRCFLQTEMDILVLENCMIRK